MAKLKSRLRAQKNTPANAKSTKSAIVQKDKKLVRKMGVLFAKSALAVGVLAGGMVFAQKWQSEQAKALAAQKQTLAQTESKKNSLIGQIESLGEAAKIYAVLSQQRQAMDFMINPVLIRPLINALRAKYRITKLNIELTPPSVLELKNFTSKTHRGSRYEITMNVGGMADHFIYQFAYDVTQLLPGFVQISAMDVNRETPLSIEVLSNISRGMNVETVSGNLKMNWFGFTAIEGSDASSSLSPKVAESGNGS